MNPAQIKEKYEGKITTVVDEFVRRICTDLVDKYPLLQQGQKFTFNMEEMNDALKSIRVNDLDDFSLDRDLIAKKVAEKLEEEEWKIHYNKKSCNTDDSTKLANVSHLISHLIHVSMEEKEEID